MENTKAKTYWDSINENYKSYPKLSANETCDVVVVGGGMAGCLTTYYLSQYNVNTILIDKDSIGHGSTLLSSGILQYELDKDLSELIKLRSRPQAVRAYKLCQKSIDDIEYILRNLNKPNSFGRFESTYLWGNKKRRYTLKDEYNLRKEELFPVEFINIEREGICSKNFAVLDPFKFCHILAKVSASKGARIYESTPLVSYDYSSDRMRINTNEFSITCKKIVFTAGYSALKLLRDDIVKFHPSYTIVTNVIEDLEGRFKKHLFHEDDGEASYNIRPLNDGRILARVTICKEDLDDNIEEKVDLLLRKITQFIPLIKNLRAEFTWKCTIGETEDGLPYIGQHPHFPNCYFNLAFGGNGDTLSAAGAQIIKDLILYNSCPDAEIFKFKR